MTPPPRRKWLQVHLSTALVLMFVAGGIIWANVRERPDDNGLREVAEFERDIRQLGVTYKATVSVALSVYGWPANAVYKSMPALVPGDGRPFNIIGNPEWHGRIPPIAVNVIIALAILFAVWFVCERWIAWRAGQKKG